MNVLIKACLVSLYLLPAPVSVYDIHITTMDGADKSLSDFKGKKIMIVILPVMSNAANSNYLKAIDSLSRNFSDKVNVIAIPSYDFGFTDNAAQSLQTYYRGILGQQVTIAQGMYTKLSSGNLQQPLFSWLTQSSQNSHFSQEVKGIGQKYFISEQGELYGVFGPEMSLTDNLMQYMINNNSDVFLGQQ